MKGGRQVDARLLMRQLGVRPGDTLLSNAWRDEREVLAIDHTGVTMRVSVMRKGSYNGSVKRTLVSVPSDTRKVSLTTISTERRLRDMEQRMVSLEREVAALRARLDAWYPEQAG